MSKSFVSIANELPVDRWLSSFEMMSFSSFHEAEAFEKKFFIALKDRHLVNLKRFLPTEYQALKPKLVSGFQIVDDGYSVFTLRVQFTPDNVDQLMTHVPTGHPSNPASYFVLAQFPDNPEITYHDLKIKRN